MLTSRGTGQSADTDSCGCRRTVDRLLAGATADADIALKNTERRLQLAQEVGNIGCYEIDMRDGTTIATSGFFALYGLPTTRTSITREEWFSFIHPADQGWMVEHLKRTRANVEQVDLEYRIVRTDGEVRWTFSRLKIDLDAEGKAVLAYGIQQDITDRKLAELALMESEEHHRHFVQVNPAIFWTADPEGNITVASTPAAANLALPESHFQPAEVSPLKVHPDDLPRVSFDWRRSLATGEPHDLEYRLLTPDGEYRWFHTRAYPRRDAENRIIRWYGASEDITRRKTAEAKLRWHASHDALTGLANRHAFQAELVERLEAARRDGGHVALLLIDLDHFKQLNDRLGHDAGDDLLKEVARRLKLAAGEDAVAARLGGDEFAAIGGAVSVDEAHAMLARFEATLAEPFDIGRGPVDSRASIGLAIGPSDGAAPEVLLKSADLALYAAKTKGRGCSVIYDGALRSAG